MPHSVQEIATALGAEAFGATEIMIDTAAEPASAGPRDLALAMSPAYGAKLAEGQARAAVVWPGCDWQALGLEAVIIAPRARLAMAKLTQLLDRPFDIADGIHPSAIVEGAEIGADVAISPFAVIGAGAVIGARSRIGAFVSVAPGSVVGEDCVLLDGVRIMRRVTLGDRVIVHPNSVIGSDGFSFVTAEVSNVERARKSLGEAEMEAPVDAVQHRIHSLGGVVIGDDVEIGACTTIDAGTIRPTKVGDGCKIDNLVQIAHNVVLGRDCVMAGQSAVAGSSVIGDRVVMGGKAAVGDNLTVGDDVVLTGATSVLSNVPAGRVMMGYPATQMAQQVEIYKALRRLPRTLKDLANRQKSVSKDA